MSEVIVVPPGTIEPVFGLRIYSELSVNVFKSDRDVVTVVTDQEMPIDNVIVIEDPSQAKSYQFVTGDGNDTIMTAPNEADKAVRMTVRAGAGNDFVVTSANDDRIFGDEGKDRLLGGDGEDALYGGSDNDWLRGGEGDDVLSGGIGDDRLAGGYGNDTLLGGEGNDIVLGGAGDDLLIAGKGRDRLIGGAGLDRFRFRADANLQLDKVVDFNPDEDLIEISRALLPGSKLLNGRLQNSDFQIVQRLNAPVNTKIIYESATGILYYNPQQAGSVPVPLLQLGQNLPIAADAIRIIS